MAQIGPYVDIDIISLGLTVFRKCLRLIATLKAAVFYSVCMLCAVILNTINPYFMTIFVLQEFGLSFLETSSLLITCGTK